jgi:ribosomal protein L11 methyltransferase
MCLEWIDAHDFNGRDVLDFGCGSGVLGIAAALKGAGSVICVDNDPQALEATTNNAERNGVTAQVICSAPEDTDDLKVDVVLANILSGPLIELAPLLQGCLGSDGEIVLSGVLKEQTLEVKRAYQACFGNLETEESEEWVCLHGKRSLPGEKID